MTLTTLTASGQITLPSEIIERLNLKPGDKIELAIAPNGRVYIQPAPIDVRTLSGMLYQAGREAISLAEMDAAIIESAGESV
ncbi:AbrB/MazE/SpoVT family DNA-binding domain-containing protein [Oscillatoria sp. FACHB-1406]|uniref:AbrB/MazE/SpoVT family DNA-binding domain-containing protein n=1 Tax=Oscillatoria sp. FACHB-1406 TaxID=2692846 RepID=UPI0016846206|nr:AbrB/MazE/SpoVT family DNA-binding domain-containing protein [Oscillatoria sp. FACHB-1406]MBD2578232.1 AbrB/MazE/SpoVT family DNA-binding domain-containing protein [Oscillatoria sp. FACHB-1406]